MDSMPEIPQEEANICLHRYVSVDSWVEISSQPSASSLSSASTSDEIITTGLRVERGSDPSHRPSRRRRLERIAAVTSARVDYSSRETSAAGSSQDEYDESESDSDRVLTSSNEDMRPQLALPSRRPRFIRAGLDNSSDDEDNDDDDDDDATALGMRNQNPSTSFVPDSNSLSPNPDPSRTRPTELHRSQTGDESNCSNVTALRSKAGSSTRSSVSRRQQQHSPYNIVSPSHHADHDAALRASLSTLLSCAAAARGLNKQDTQPPTSSEGSHGQPSSFRLVPASTMDEEGSEEERTGSTSAKAGGVGESGGRMSSKERKTVGARTGPPKGKRRAGSSKERGMSRTRKSRRTNVGVTSSGMGSTAGPTIMGWVFSAGLVVLVSAISFSAGYVIGHEVGRAEMAIGGGGFPGSRASA